VKYREVGAKGGEGSFRIKGSPPSESDAPREQLNVEIRRHRNQYELVGREYRAIVRDLYIRGQSQRLVLPKLVNPTSPSSLDLASVARGVSSRTADFPK
jgi:hypothetical protein